MRLLAGRKRDATKHWTTCCWRNRLNMPIGAWSYSSRNWNTFDFNAKHTEDKPRKCTHFRNLLEYVYHAVAACNDSERLLQRHAKPVIVVTPEHHEHEKLDSSQYPADTARPEDAIHYSASYSRKCTCKKYNDRVLVVAVVSKNVQTLSPWKRLRRVKRRARAPAACTPAVETQRRGSRSRSPRPRRGARQPAA